MAIGPSEGNGFEWIRGPWTMGLWQETLEQVGVDALILGHREGAQWQRDAVVETLDSWQGEIDRKAGGMIGKFYIENMIPQVNDILDKQFPLNPFKDTPIQNTDKYSVDVQNALISQYTEVGPDGKLRQKSFFSRVLEKILA